MDVTQRQYVYAMYSFPFLSSSFSFFFFVYLSGLRYGKEKNREYIEANEIYLERVECGALRQRFRDDSFLL